MTKAIAIYTDNYRYSLSLAEGQEAVLAPSEPAAVFISSLSSPVTLRWAEGELTYRYEKTEGRITDGLELAGLTFYSLDGARQVYNLLDKQELLIGSRSGSDLYLEKSPAAFWLRRKEKSWELHLLEGELYLNNRRLSQSVCQLEPGDELSMQGLLLKVYGEELWVSGAFAVSEALAEMAASRYSFYEGYPDYHRSPRIIYRSSEDPVTINAPEKEPKKPEDGLLRMILPPLIMVSLLIVISIIQPRGIYIIITMAMSTVTVIFAISNYFKKRRQYKRDKKDRVAHYQRYLSDKAMELEALARDQRQGQFYHYPDTVQLDEMAAQYHHRIYEKTLQQFDALHYRLGLGKVAASYPLKYSQTERSGQTDPLEAQGYQLYQKSRELTGMPIAANLMHGPVGYTGPRALVLEQLQLMVRQLAFFHSYHDLQFIVVLPEEEVSQWSWLRWLPHAKLQALNVRGLVYNQRTRDQVLTSLNQTLKVRQGQRQEGQKERTVFSPHYVVLVTDRSLMMDHVIMEFFTEDPTALGCSLVFVEDVLSSLSENVQTIVTIKDRNSGELVLEEGELRAVPFALDHFPAGYDKEALSRRLAPLNHLQNLKASIPETVSFLELYGVETVSELGIAKRWASHAPHRTLSVPLGLRGQEDVVALDLHEQAHGPHGLIAGTTGSGKSELIQSYILSLAVSFHPYDVGFLLIDYKGGGMANLFKDLPHLLGTITNLDGAQSRRALIAIDAELKRRQRLFSQYGVNHINAYQKLFKEGEAKEPLPHLFLISDEFAELKANQSDFMDDLVSTARLGRSLGVHLILATQKPSGVVNDQIWSNARFKIALKVANRQDSTEMLKTPDAAEITQTGRAYLQVGNNEVYELFQSAWSGAPYQPEKAAQGIADQTIYAINALGQYELLNQDLSGLDGAQSIEEVPTELEAVVAEIGSVAAREHIGELTKPWLPPLKERIYAQDLRPGSFKEHWQEAKEGLSALLGFVDLPRLQTQEIVSHNFERQGNLVIYSGPGMGKSTLLQTMIMDLAQQHTPENVQFYLFDFGTNGLLPLRRLPHVIDSLSLEDTEKLPKFMRRIREEIARRKRLFSRYSAANMTMYRQMSGDRLPYVFLMIDGYDSLREDTEIGPNLEGTIQSVARDGSSLGIYVVITASRSGIIRPALQANMKSRLIFKMTDENDNKTLMGRHDYLMEDLPGRGLVRYDGPEVFQAALPAYGAEHFEVLENLQNLVAQMDSAWLGPRPLPIPVVPEKLTIAEFTAIDSVQTALNEGNISIGLDFETVEAENIPIQTFKHLLYVSDNGDSLKAITNHLVQATAVSSHLKVMLLDSQSEFLNFKENVSTYVNDDETLQDMGNQLMLELDKRQELNHFEKWVIIIPDLDNFLSASAITRDQLMRLYKIGWKYGMYLLIGCFHQFIGTSIDDLLKSIRSEFQWIILGMRLNDQSFLDKVYNAKEARLEADEIYLHNRKQYKKIKISHL
ncbi:type VII secretion protein EssC [Streptococcus chenjunshii]|uniref:Type VII secretion protein EssC n=1 Tax=Streptococcus chenjunshii TaxID=2173853 RepID=A0A372KIW2_9STRE|nr:type VII secretion protein EssC [Streptococcus chenjunshii]AXQ79543.1 type VII secretion protein EssC [Streptococcus chenjunshii]RFU51458.1 type VII secretion protein EssC [Streptococcus chenjunshii]RFU52232.1 type VII secretion protein EssC [Streptococcus chenjunshii]